MFRKKLEGKNVLFVGVKFYHYHQEIQNKMEEYGANVSFYPERDTSIKYGIVNRLFPKWLDKYQKIHYNYILRKVRGQKLDYLLVIRGHRMPLTFIQQIKKNNPGIVCIMYQWDANINSPFLNLPPEFNIVPEFDKVLSFDYKDVEDNPAILTYCPTFYTDEIKKLVSDKNNVLKYDFFYFGSYLPERYIGLLKIKAFSEANGYTLKSHFFMPFRYYLIETLKGTKLDRNVISSKKMSREVYVKLFSETKVIVDVSNAKQTGMAMRVLDALGAGKKVLTTNKWVNREPQYDPNQILVIDMNNLEIPRTFLDAPLKPSKVDYSLDNWLKIIFN